MSQLHSKRWECNVESTEVILSAIARHAALLKRQGSPGSESNWLRQNLTANLLIEVLVFNLENFVILTQIFYSFFLIPIAHPFMGLNYGQ